jgi:hypothetical protein
VARRLTWVSNNSGSHLSVRVGKEDLTSKTMPRAGDA